MEYRAKKRISMRMARQMEGLTQTERILYYLDTIGEITQLEAIRDLSCMRLASRITDLRKQGYKIKSEIVSVRNKYGEHSNIALYTLVSE